MNIPNLLQAGESSVACGNEHSLQRFANGGAKLFHGWLRGLHGFVLSKQKVGSALKAKFVRDSATYLLQAGKLLDSSLKPSILVHRNCPGAEFGEGRGLKDASGEYKVKGGSDSDISKIGCFLQRETHNKKPRS